MLKYEDRWLPGMSANSKEIQRLANIYKALGEPTRLQIVKLLARNKELSCTELSERLNANNCSTLSHHLKLLTDCGLIKLRKEGTYHIFSLQLDEVRHVAPGVLEL
jgi:DNA-binding transcriptional ArsR family regulator